MNFIDKLSPFNYLPGTIYQDDKVVVTYIDSTEESNERTLRVYEKIEGGVIDRTKEVAGLLDGLFVKLYALNLKGDAR